MRQKLFQFRWLFILGLIHGLIYVFLMPPWQHYDEQNHFEVAWLVSQGELQPTNDDVQPEFRRKLLQSMIDNDFYEGMDYKPDINATVPKIGQYSQFNDPKLYYWLLGYLYRAVGDQPVEILLYTGRIFSLSLYLLTLLAAWEISKIITPRNHPIRIAVPYFLVFLPAFVDLMTAVNNEVLAVMITSFSLWGFVHILHMGLNWKNLGLTAVCVVLALFSRSTLYLLIPLFVVVVLIGLFSETKVTKRIWVGVLFLILVFSVSITLIGDASHWLRGVDQDKFTRIKTPISPHGEYAFQFDTRANTTPRWIEPLSQSLPIEDSNAIKGDVVSVGAWIWADSPQKTRTPMIRQGYQEWFNLVEVTKVPTFYSFKVKIPDEEKRIWIAFDPYLYETTRGDIYYDGIVVTSAPIENLDRIPTFSDQLGSNGYWDETAFLNLVRNPSAERGWFTIRPIVDEFGSRILPDQARPSFLLGVAQDFSNLDWFLSITVKRLIRTFWAKFGWAHINLLGSKPYRLFGFLSLLGVLGAGIWIVKDINKFPKNSVVVFFLMILGFWLPNLARGFILLAADRLYFPVSRYNYPAIIPTAYFLTIGWIFILNLLRIPKSIQLILFFGFFIIVDIWSIISIWVFYHGRIL